MVMVVMVVVMRGRGKCRAGEHRQKQCGGKNSLLHARHPNTARAAKSAAE